MNITIPTGGVPAEVNFGLNGTLKNGGPGVIYYRDESPVTNSVNDAALTLNSSATLNGSTYMISDTGAVAICTIGQVTAESGVGEPGPPGADGADGPEGPSGADGAPGEDAISPMVLVNSANNYTLVITDAFARIQISNAASRTVTVPTNATVAFETGTVIEICQRGIGPVVIAPAVGVTLNSPDGLTTTRSQFSLVSILKVDTNEWDMVGDLV